MIYNTEEIRLTSEDYVRCIELFYALKEQGNTRGYDSKIISVEEDGVDFDSDFLSFDLSSAIVEQFEMLSNMTIKTVLDKLRFIMTHAIYSLYEVQELLKQNKTAYRLCPNFTLNAYLEGNVFKNVLNYLLECHRLYNYFVDGDYFNCCIRYVHEDVKNPFHMYNNKGEDVAMTSPVIQHVAFTTRKEIAVHEVMENLHAVMFMLAKLHLDKLKTLRKIYQDALELNSNWHTRVKYNDNRDVGLINTMYINLPKEIKSTDVEHIDTVRLVKDVVDVITIGVGCNYSCEKDKITVFDTVSAMVCHSDTLLRDTYGDGYTNYDATTKVFLDKMGSNNINKHISQAMMLYIIYYFRYKIKNDTYLRLERLKHALEFENGTVDTDVECKDGHILTLNRRYVKRDELIGSIINFDTLPIKSSDYSTLIPSVLIMMLDVLRVVGATWYRHVRFMSSMHMVQLMYELKYENYDNLFCEYYTSSDTFKLKPDTYCTNSDDDIHINWYHCGNTVLPTYGTYDRNTILKDTVFVNSGYLTEARMGLITLLKVVDDTLKGDTKEVDSLELRYNMADYNYNMEFHITFTDGETVVRHTEFNLADFYYLYGLLLYCESVGWKSSLFNYKMDIYSFKTTIKDMAYRINAVAKEFYTFNGDLIDNDVYDILESVMSHAKGYKKSLGSSQVIEEKEVEDMGTEVVDPVVEVLTKYSNGVDVKYIARVLSNEFMLSGYDYIVVKDDKMKVYSTDGSKCQVIAKPLHRFFYNADTIDKLPLLYYLID